MAEAVAGLVFEIDSVNGQTFGFDGKAHEVAWRELQRNEGIVFHRRIRAGATIAPTAETAASIPPAAVSPDSHRLVSPFRGLSPTRCIPSFRGRPARPGAVASSP